MIDECEQTRTEQRQEARFALEVAASVRRRGASQMPATLYDLSCGGCSVGGALLPPGRNDDVFVRIPGLESLSTRVRWSEDGRNGLEFERRLHPAVFQRLISLHGHGTMPAPTLTYSAPVPPTETPRERPGSSRREQIMGGFVMPEHGLLLDKQPVAGGKSLFSLVRRNTARQADHRHEPRYPAPDDASVAVGPQDRPAEIANISSSGIMALGKVGQEIGDSLAVHFAGCEPIWGTLIWKRGDQFGLSLPRDSIMLAETG